MEGCAEFVSCLRDLGGEPNFKHAEIVCILYFCSYSVKKFYPSVSFQASKSKDLLSKLSLLKQFAPILLTNFTSPHGWFCSWSDVAKKSLAGEMRLAKEPRLILTNGANE